jgi:hypothetical protein
VQNEFCNTIVRKRLTSGLPRIDATGQEQTVVFSFDYFVSTQQKRGWHRGLDLSGMRWGYPRAPILSCVLVSPSYELVPKHTQVPPNARVCRENAFAHPHFPPRLIISRIPTRQIQGRDVSMRIQRATGGTQGKSLRPLTVYKNVFEPIARGATFRDPHPAFSAAICVQLSVAGAASDSSRQTH